MERVSAGLLRATASVRWIEPPQDRPSGWDAADALAEPDGRDLVGSLLDVAMDRPEFEPTLPHRGPADAKSLIFRTAVEIAELVPDARLWASVPWLAYGALTELSGKVKASGKTTFVFAMVNAIARGEPFLGEPTLQSPVIILSEQPLTSLRVALDRAGLSDCQDVEVLTWAEASGTPWPEVAAAAVTRCQVLGARVLVVDTLSQFAGLRGDSENDSGAAMVACPGPSPVRARRAALRACAGRSALVRARRRRPSCPPSPCPVRLAVSTPTSSATSAQPCRAAWSMRPATSSSERPRRSSLATTRVSARLLCSARSTSAMPGRSRSLPLSAASSKISIRRQPRRSASATMAARWSPLARSRYRDLLWERRAADAHADARAAVDAHLEAGRLYRPAPANDGSGSRLQSRRAFSRARR